MSGWLNWLVLLSGLGVVFTTWSWVPIERLDRWGSWINPIGRPLANTLVITGLPALYAKLTHTPWPILLIPITFFLTQYAVLTGRALKKEMLIAGWVMAIATVVIWMFFFFDIADRLKLAPQPRFGLAIFLIVVWIFAASVVRILSRHHLWARNAVPRWLVVAGVIAKWIGQLAVVCLVIWGVYWLFGFNLFALFPW